MGNCVDDAKKNNNYIKLNRHHDVDGLKSFYKYPQMWFSYFSNLMYSSYYFPCTYEKKKTKYRVEYHKFINAYLDIVLDTHVILLDLFYCHWHKWFMRLSAHKEEESSNLEEEAKIRNCSNCNTFTQKNLNGRSF